nr:DUF421 domain-containing protein [Thalassobacillus sp. CUG 92003]
MVFRMMGKREIGELSVMDLVVFIMLAEIAIFIIEDPESNIWNAIVPMSVLFLIQKLSALIALRSRKFRDWFDGKPAMIIRHGKVDEHEMRKQRYNFNDLLMQLREKGIESIQEVDFAILEPSGKLSVFEKKEDDPSGLSIPLVSDGEIQYSSLRKVRKNQQWLTNELAKRGYNTLENISFCSIDEQGELFIDVKNEFR